MYTIHKNVQIILAMLKAYGVQNLVGIGRDPADTVGIFSRGRQFFQVLFYCRRTQCRFLRIGVD